MPFFYLLLLWQHPLPFLYLLLLRQHPLPFLYLLLLRRHNRRLNPHLNRCEDCLP